MEFSLSSLSYSLLILIFLLLLPFLFFQRFKSKSKCKLPPGPSSIPFLGNLHHIAICHCPHQTLHDMAKSLGPIMFFQTGDAKLLVLSTPDAAKEVMKVHDAKFVNRPQLAATESILYGSTDIAFSRGPYWRQFRKICVTELLSVKRVKSFSWIRQAETCHMLKTFSEFANDSTPVNFGEMVSELSNRVVLRAAFGGRCKRQREFVKIMKEAADTCAYK